MARVFGLTERSFRRMRRAVRRIEKSPRFGSQRRRVQPVVGTTQRVWLGKPIEDLTAGPQTESTDAGSGSGESFPLVQPWRGPAYGAEDEAVGDPREVHYATDDFLADEYVSVTEYRGKRYVSCFLAGSGGSG